MMSVLRKVRRHWVRAETGSRDSDDDALPVLIRKKATVSTKIFTTLSNMQMMDSDLHDLHGFSTGRTTVIVFKCSIKHCLTPR